MTQSNVLWSTDELTARSVPLRKSSTMGLGISALHPGLPYYKAQDIPILDCGLDR